MCWPMSARAGVRSPQSMFRVVSVVVLVVLVVVVVVVVIVVVVGGGVIVVVIADAAVVVVVIIIVIIAVVAAAEVVAVVVVVVAAAAAAAVASLPSPPPSCRRLIELVGQEMTSAGWSNETFDVSGNIEHGDHRVVDAADLASIMVRAQDSLSCCRCCCGGRRAVLLPTHAVICRTRIRRRFRTLTHTDDEKHRRRQTHADLHTCTLTQHCGQRPPGVAHVTAVTGGGPFAVI